MRILGNVNMKHNQLQETRMELVSVFPEAKLGKFVFRSDEAQAFLCVSEAPVAWIPIGNKAAYVHTQGTPSMLWTINHTLGSEDLFFEVYDSAGNVILADEITVVDVNTVTVSFGTSSVAGKVVVAAMDGNAAVDIQVINDAIQGAMTTWSSDKIVAYVAANGGRGGGGTWGSITGTLSAQTDLQGALTTLQNNINSETTARTAADTTLQTNINAKAEIDDLVTNTTDTWSSQKITNVIAASGSNMDGLYVMGGIGE